MSREFPDLLNPWKAADGRRTFEGTMPLRRMRRLHELLAPQDGSGVAWQDPWFRADFGHDSQGNVTVELWVEAELPLICQRSLRPYLEPVKRHSLLAVVESVEEQELLPEDYEPVLVEQGHMALLEVVEDELLLAVPQVPRNPGVAEVDLSTDGAAPAEPTTEPTRRPFEGLAGLLKQRKD
ncbi:DUF177 domain-containing protein [Pseudomonadota bacterium]|jgi:uncharacterized protein